MVFLPVLLLVPAAMQDLREPTRFVPELGKPLAISIRDGENFEISPPKGCHGLKIGSFRPQDALVIYRDGRDRGLLLVPLRAGRGEFEILCLTDEGKQVPSPVEVVIRPAGDRVREYWIQGAHQISVHEGETFRVRIDEWSPASGFEADAGLDVVAIERFNETERKHPRLGAWIRHGKGVRGALVRARTPGPTHLFEIFESEGGAVNRYRIPVLVCPMLDAEGMTVQITRFGANRDYQGSRDEYGKLRVGVRLLLENSKKTAQTWKVVAARVETESDAREFEPRMSCTVEAESSQELDVTMPLLAEPDLPGKRVRMEITLVDSAGQRHVLRSWTVSATTSS